MFCAISGESPQEPVISRKSGFLYEKRLILKYIADSDGKEPGTGESLSEEDLVPVKLTTKIVRPRPPNVNSVPALLGLMQNEWDSLALETYQLRQQQHQLRQELSNALYELDAAKRVIARLARERDQARDNLAAVTAAGAVAGTNGGMAGAAAPAAPDGGMEVDETAPAEAAAIAGVNSEIAQKMDAVAAELSKHRKKRKPGPDVASTDDIKSYKSLAEITGVHSTTHPGITALDLHRSTEWVLTGGKDGAVIVTRWKDEKQIATVKAHSGKAITAVAWAQRGALVAPEFSAEGIGASDPLTFITGSVDKTVKVWSLRRDGEGDEVKGHVGKAESVVKGHQGEITGLAVHPTAAYFVSASSDSTWAFADIETGTQVSRNDHSDVKKGYSAVSFHPDGLILGTGTTDSIVRIWEAKSATNVKSFDDAGTHAGKITSLAFSENGYYLATSADGHGLVRLWDLRKLSNFHTIDLEQFGVKSVSRVAFDASGQYLGVSGSDGIRVFLNKQWDLLTTFSSHKDHATDFKFGDNARYVVSCGMDRKISVVGV